MDLKPETENLLEKATRQLAEAAAQTSFKLWQEAEFRQMVKFDSISQTEQDRIFNELEISFLGLFILELDCLKLQTDDDQQTRELLIKLQTLLVEGFLDIFRDLQIAPNLIKTWEALIDMRLKEYRQDFKVLMDNSDEEFKDQLEFKPAWARIQTITLDCLDHIRRGKWDESDPLRRYLQKRVIIFDQTFGEPFKKLVFLPQGYA